MLVPLIENCKVFEKRRICMLMVTHACNLNCTYCYESFKGQRFMNTSLAKEILQKEFALVRNSDKFNELEIDFMGGEPLMNFTLIKEVVEWLLDQKWDVPFITFCSTNGTLVGDDNKEWLNAHKDVLVLGLSYDGDFDMQMQNRGTAKKDIDIKFFMDTWPWEPFHITISKDTLPHLAQGILSLQRAGGRLTAALAQGVDWTEDDAALFGEQLSILREAYIEDDALKPINLLGRPLYGIANPDRVQRKFCGTGTSMIAYDIDGKTYPCHMFSPIVLGPEGALELAKSGITENSDIADNFCDSCFLRSWCPTCYGFNYRFRGSISKRDHRWCSMIHAQAIASCEFQIAYYHKHMAQLTDKDMAQLKGALEFYHAFMDLEGKTARTQKKTATQIF